MSGLQLVASIVSSLAWPAVVVAAAILLRRELAAAVRRLSTLEFRGAKLTFDALSDFQQIEAISETAARISEASAKKAHGDEGTANRTNDAEFGALETLAESAPRQAIIEAWGLLEYHLDAAADRIAPSLPHGWPQVAHTLEAWSEWEVLFPVVVELRMLRDYTARTSRPPLSSDAARYVAVVQNLLTILRASFTVGSATTREVTSERFA